MRRPTQPFALAALLLTVACGGGDDPVLTAQVYKPRGSFKCFGGGTSIESLRRQLVDGGIEVSAAACGTDGRTYADVCGAPDGAIGVFEIPLAKVEAAAGLLFAPLATLDTARIVPCTS